MINRFIAKSRSPCSVYLLSLKSSLRSRPTVKVKFHMRVGDGCLCHGNCCTEDNRAQGRNGDRWHLRILTARLRALVT